VPRVFGSDPVKGRNALGAVWGFTTAKDSIPRIGRIRKRRKSFRISDRSGFDSQALPPPYRSGESAGSARLLPLDPTEALVLTDLLVYNLPVQWMPTEARFVLLVSRPGERKGAAGRRIHAARGAT
jgi:hypothetical protein